MNHHSRRRLLVGVVVVLSVALGGCVTLDPSVTADTGNSAVFESVSVGQSWSGEQIVGSASLKANSRAGNVTQLSVIDAKGESVATTTVAPGQTSVSVTLPTNANATIVASDTVNGTTIEKLNVSVTGNKLF